MTGRRSDEEGLKLFKVFVAATLSISGTIDPMRQQKLWSKASGFVQEKTDSLRNGRYASATLFLYQSDAVRAPAVG